MPALTCIDCIDLWERGERLHPLDRDLLALHALPGSADTDPADWPIGRRNAGLVRLHGRSFGRELKGLATCRSCGARLELEIDGEALAAADTATSDRIEFRGALYRLPTSRDIAMAFALPPNGDPASFLVDRCRVSPGETVQLSDSELEQIGDLMAQSDPLAECRIGMTCTDCGAEWEEMLDIGAFVWAEIEARAKRSLFEVHTLASAYGWSESEILALSPSRRRFYMRMVGE